MQDLKSDNEYCAPLRSYEINLISKTGKLTIVQGRTRYYKGQNTLTAQNKY